MAASGIRGEPGWLLRIVLAGLLAIVTVAVGFVLFAAPAAPGLGDAVDTALARSGADNPVTSVLLNFRGYDTLLEMAVLTTALFGVWALGPAPRVGENVPSPVLLGLNSVLIPLVPLICAYLLWVGATRAGGAFQAGAVLAAASVLYILSGRRPRTPLPDASMRWMVIIGLAVFLGVSFGVMGDGRRFLEYPVDLAGALMLLIETTATVSIAMILTGLFIGGRPEDEP